MKQRTTVEPPLAASFRKRQHCATSLSGRRWNGEIVPASVDQRDQNLLTPEKLR